MRVVKNGLGLGLTIYWLKPIRDVGRLHVKWLGPTKTEPITAYHPRFEAFENALKEYHKHSQQNILSNWIFKLPFTVRKNMAAQYNMILEPNETRVVYVDLKTNAKEYVDVQDTASFEKFP